MAAMSGKKKPREQSKGCCLFFLTHSFYLYKEFLHRPFKSERKKPAL